jgi:histone-lysine N-methyltransferase SETMAR
LGVLIKVQEQVRKKRPGLWKKKSWSLHQDNEPAHNALVAKQFLADKCIPVLEHPPPPYSPDLAPCDFFLFIKVKSALKGTHFQSVDEME